MIVVGCRALLRACCVLVVLVEECVVLEATVEVKGVAVTVEAMAEREIAEVPESRVASRAAAAATKEALLEKAVMRVELVGRRARHPSCHTHWPRPCLWTRPH